VLRVINDDIIAGGGGFGFHPHKDMEIITYVLSGSLRHEDSLGNGGVIAPGDVQRMSAGSGIIHSEFNASKDEETHLLQIWIFPREKNLPPSYEQKNIVDRNLKNQWQLVASPDGSGKSVTIHQDASLSVALLTQGAEIDYAPAENRQVWLHVATGSVMLDDVELAAGDGVGIRSADVIKLAASADSEVLLFDLERG
jgi:redox-sensitive bicupin YhaK (pirin superfamily)